MRLHPITVCTLAVVFLSNPVSAATAGSAAQIDIYTAAVNNAARNEKDRARDAGRQPGAVLNFLGIIPGMTVLNLYSGGGYYTELLSYVVGPNGQVVAHSNEAYAGIASAETSVRYADERLANVDTLMAENNELKLQADSFDAILMVLSYHDIYYVDVKSGWPEIDGEKLLAELYRGARPGAVLGIVDHYAAAGSPRETGGTTHRIDPAIVIADIEAAGFRLEQRSDVLRNPADDYDRIVFEPDLRGKTDRFVLRFRKPH